MREQHLPAGIVRFARSSVIAAITVTLAWAPLPALAATGPLCYVNMDAAGSNNGNSWANAYTDLQDALTDTNCSKVWVAQGHYSPGSNDSDSFVIRSGTKVYGGFAGGETSLSQSRPQTHLTILTGDIGGDDDTNNNDLNFITENYNEVTGTNNDRVVVFNGTVTPVTAATVLDGFVITAGHADELYTVDDGAGAYCDASVADSECSPTLRTVLFVGNKADGNGGGFAASAANGGVASPTLADVSFLANYATAIGGGMAAYADTGGTTNPMVSGATFADNFSSSYGGGVAISTAGAASASPSFTNVTFAGNFGGVAGGAVTLFSTDAGSSAAVILTNITSSGNSVSSMGGALYLYEGGDLTATTVTNSILWDGSAGSGTELYVDNTASADVSYSVVDGGCANPSVSGPGSAVCSNILSGDPNLAALGNYGGSTQTMPLLAGSSALNMGTNTGCPAVDQRGIMRPQMEICDIGATETRYKKAAFKSKGGQDGWVLETAQGTGIGGSLNSAATTLRVGDDGQDRAYRSILSFDTGSLPDWFIPDFATLQLRSAGAAGNPAPLGAMRADCWTGGFLGASTALESADYDDLVDTTGAVGMGAAPSNGWFTAIMFDPGFSCIDPGGATQLRLMTTTQASDLDGVPDYTKLSSGNADGSLRPRLTIKYYIP